MLMIHLIDLNSTLFVDAVVQSGTNPAIMLIKELVESEQFTETKATWALAAVGYFAKTPTRELLHELVVMSTFNYFSKFSSLIK